MGRSEAAPPPGHALRPGDDTARCSFGEADLLSELGAIESVTPPVPARKLHRTRTSRNLERDCRGLCDELGLGAGACEPDVEARRRRERRSRARAAKTSKDGNAGLSLSIEPIGSVARSELLY